MSGHLNQPFKNPAIFLRLTDEGWIDTGNDRRYRIPRRPAEPVRVELDAWQALGLRNRLDSSFPDRLDERLVVALILVGIFDCELVNSVIKGRIRAHISYNPCGVSRPCVRPR